MASRGKGDAELGKIHSSLGVFFKGDKKIHSMDSRGNRRISSSRLFFFFFLGGGVRFV